jgi:hypothetical protein
MSKRKARRDINQIAASIVSQTTADGKNVAAVALGRLGGLKGGRVRAARLSAEAKSAIAKKAAQARWSKAKREK